MDRGPRLISTPVEQEGKITLMYKVHIDREHMQWLMERVEERCTDKETANLLRIYGRYDLEIAIVVAPQDRCLITDEFLVDMKHSMRARTRLSPVIYLDGDEPRSVRAYAELLAIYAVDDPPY
jgi:hypothetical protein